MGNGRGLRPDEGGQAADGVTGGRLQGLFRSFERQLEGSARADPKDPEVERALQARETCGRSAPVSR